MQWIMEREFFPNTSEKHIIQLQIGDGEAIGSAVLSTGHHIGKLGAVTHQVTQFLDIRGGIKLGLIISHINKSQIHFASFR